MAIRNEIKIPVFVNLYVLLPQRVIELLDKKFLLSYFSLNDLLHESTKYFFLLKASLRNSPVALENFGTFALV